MSSPLDAVKLVGAGRGQRGRPVDGNLVVVNPREFIGGGEREKGSAGDFLRGRVDHDREGLRWGVVDLDPEVTGETPTARLPGFEIEIPDAVVDARIGFGGRWSLRDVVRSITGFLVEGIGKSIRSLGRRPSQFDRFFPVPGVLVRVGGRGNHWYSRRRFLQIKGGGAPGAQEFRANAVGLFDLAGRDADGRLSHRLDEEIDPADPPGSSLVGFRRPALKSGRAAVVGIPGRRRDPEGADRSAGGNRDRFQLGGGVGDDRPVGIGRVPASVYQNIHREVGPDVLGSRFRREEQLRPRGVEVGIESRE